MGSYNPYPGAEIKPEQQQTRRKEVNAEEDITISMLINSIHYFIECVFILHLKGKYRLVVLQHGKVLHDRYYPTKSGGKIAFGKLFKEKAWSEEIKAQWSHFYDPDKKWLEEKTRGLES